PATRRPRARMTQHKLFAVTIDRDTARVLAGAMQDLVEPAPDALTLFEAGADGWRIEAYYSEEPDAAMLQSALEDLLGRPLPALTPESIPDLNWVALSQAALPPVTAGRFTVHGSHDRSRVPRGPNAILIDAGEAFGTAHHATTYGCLAAIDRLTRRRRFTDVLDLGCGSGVLAIAASRALPKAHILATDIDLQSVVVANANMRANGAARRVRVAATDGVGRPVVRAAAPFDLVIANILAGPLIALSGDVARIAAPGAAIVLSGLLIHQAPAVVAAYRAHGFSLVRHDRITGWSTLTLAKRCR
ncbi:MAG: 50S ribosomal protein L11 methyltransferase, partial [Hyphomicrobiaceae bacterium]|nr:50S ribosomal protein L11 methyltransferase [Hyphomicrobiaceae bacterium]